MINRDRLIEYPCEPFDYNQIFTDFLDRATAKSSLRSIFVVKPIKPKLTIKDLLADSEE